MSRGRRSRREAGGNPRARGLSPRQQHQERVLAKAAGRCEECGVEAQLRVAGYRIGEMVALCSTCNGEVLA